jgi:hypothetical protein
MAGMKSSAPTTSVELLFCGTHDWKSTSQRQSSSRVTSHIWVYIERCVHPPLENATSVSTQDQWYRMSAPDVSHQMNQFGPIFLVRFTHSHCQECDCITGVRPCSLGGIQSLCHQVVEFHGLGLCEFLAVLVYLEQAVRSCTCLCASTFWLCLVKRS